MFFKFLDLQRWSDNRNAFIEKRNQGAAAAVAFRSNKTAMNKRQ